MTIRSFFPSIFSFVARLFGFGPSSTAQPAGHSAAALHVRSAHLPDRGPHQRTGHSRFTKSLLNREHRDLVKQIAKESRRRNRGL